MFSFGVLLAQLITSEYPRLDTRKEQVRLQRAVEGWLKVGKLSTQTYVLFSFTTTAHRHQLVQE